MAKKKRKLKKGVRFLLLAIAAVLCAVPFFFRTPEKQEAEKEEVPVKADSYLRPTPTPIPKEVYELEDEDLLDLKKEYQADREINADLQGILVFQNGLLKQPFFQGKDNDFYLYHAWETKEYRSWGSICLDYENEFEKDQNNTIYGHYVYPERTPDRTVMFTPLSLLMKEENYENNQYLAVAREDEIIYYEIIYVYRCHLLPGEYIPDELMYSTRSFTEKELDTYIGNLKKHLFYDTGKELSSEDRFITLQTCIEGTHLDREIVISREIERKPYPEESTD